MLRFAFYCCFQGLHWDQTFSSAICEWWSPFVFRFWNLWKIYWWYIHLYGETKALCKNFVPPCYSRRSSVHSHWWMAPSVATLLFWISCRRLELSQSVYSRPSPVPRCFGVSLSFHPWLTTLPSNDVESGVYWCEVYFRYFRWNTPQPMTWGHWPYCWGRGEVDRGVSQTSLVLAETNQSLWNIRATSTIVRIQGTVRSLFCANKVCCQPKARGLG